MHPPHILLDFQCCVSHVRTRVWLLGMKAFESIKLCKEFFFPDVEISRKMAVHWYWAALMACMTVAPVSPTNVVGYMPEWRHEGADFTRLSLHLTHLIFFSLEITPKAHLHDLDIRSSETVQVKFFD